MNEVLNSDIAQAGGWTTVYLSIGLTVLEWLGETTVNDILQGVLLLGSIVFLWFKIKNSRLDAKIKQRELNKKE